MALESIVQFYTTMPTWLILVLSVWVLVWKGLALWKSARIRSPIWFIVILVTNTIGILPILYIFIFSEMRSGKKNANKIQKAPKRKTSKKSKR